MVLEQVWSKPLLGFFCLRLARMLSEMLVRTQVLPNAVYACFDRPIDIILKNRLIRTGKWAIEVAR